MSNRSSFWPTALNLNHKQLLIVGGGDVAHKRFLQWTGRGAVITAVAETFCTSFEESVLNAPDLSLYKRTYQADDLTGKRLVYIATNDSALNERIEQECHAQGIWCCRADAKTSDFHTLSLIEKGPIQIGIGTSGQSPAVSGQIRQLIEETLPLETLEKRIELMAALKVRLKIDVKEQSQRGLLLSRALGLTIEDLEGLLTDEAIYSRFKG